MRRFFNKKLRAVCAVILMTHSFSMPLAAEDAGAKAVPAVVPSVADPVSAAKAAVMTPLGDATPSPEGTSGLVSLDLRNIDVVDALKFLAMKANMNIITTKNVSGRVTFMVDGVPIKDIFDIMLRSNSLAYAKVGNIYNVMTEDEYKAIYGRKFNDVRKVRIMRLNYAIPEQAFSMLDALKSDVGRILVEPDSGTAMVMDAPENIIEMESAIMKLEEKNDVRIFELKYAKAKEVEEQLKSQIDLKKVGTIKADERSNSLIVQTLPGRMKLVENMISSLDVKTKEVLIDTKIVKVKLTDNLQRGIEWEGIGGLGAQLGMMYMGSTPFSVIQTATTAAATVLPTRNQFLNNSYQTRGIGSVPFSGNSGTNLGGRAVSPGEAMHIGVINRDTDIDLLVRFLSTIGNTQVLAAPKLAVINNHEARIHVGERQAYVTSTTTTGQSTSTVSEEVTFVDVGIQLSITPTINSDGYITMKVKPEISSVVDTLVTNQGNSIPIIDTSMAETTVMVKDGTTIIIGGLRKEDKIADSKGIPYLEKLPMIGFIFKNETKRTERTELMVLMTPYIISGDKLVTGDDKAFLDQSGKDYKGYKKLAPDKDIKPLKDVPEGKIKTYAEYSQYVEESKGPEIKGVKR